MSKGAKSSRRDFLKGKSAVKALRKAVQDVQEGMPVPVESTHNRVDRQNAYLEHYTANAMACEFAIMFNMHQYPQSGAVTAAAFDLISRYENQLTIYDQESEVSQLNRLAFENSVGVEKGLFELLSLAHSIHHDTQGAFDITASPLSKIWGFENRQGRVPTQAEIDAVLSSVGMEGIVLDTSLETVRFLKEGVGINLGGIGKGFALDKVAESITRKNVTNFLIHGGQSSVVARGNQIESETSQEEEFGWTVGLSHPMSPDQRLCEFFLRDEALGTSGTGRQGFYVEGKRYGHIIDPRTGWPTDHFLSTTVVSESAARSDALATAFFVMDLESVERYCRKHPEVKAVVVSQDERSKIELNWFNLSDRDWRRD